MVAYEKDQWKEAIKYAAKHTAYEDIPQDAPKEQDDDNKEDHQDDEKINHEGHCSFTKQSKLIFDDYILSGTDFNGLHYKRRL